MTTTKQHEEAHRHLNRRQFDRPTTHVFGTGWYLPPGFGWGLGSTAQDPYPDSIPAGDAGGDSGGGGDGGGI